MYQTNQSMIVSTLPPRKKSNELGLRRAYTTPKVVALGDIRGVTMGSGSKNIDLDDTQTLI